MKKHDLLHALSDADEALVDRAADSMRPHFKSTGTARFFRVGAIAASVAIVLAAGAVAIPMMLTEDPAGDAAIPPVSDSMQGSVSDALTQSSPDNVIQAPTSILYLTSNDQPKEIEGIVDSETQDSYWGDNLALLTFDCEEGETVSATTFWESLFTRTYPNDGHETWEGLEPTNPEDRKTYMDILSTFRFGGLYAGKRNVTLDVNAEYLLWKYDTRNLKDTFRDNINHYLKKLESVKAKFGEDSWQYLKALEEYEERYDAKWGDDYNGLQLEPNEDILSYMTHNADGEITGVGAIYVYRKHLIANEESNYYADNYISRYADLGYVRFDSPKSEEDANEELKKLYEAIPEAKTKMDFAPVSENENYKAGLADLLNTLKFESPEDHYTTSGFGGSSGDNFRTFHIGWVSKDEDVIDGNHADRVFRIYSDGTWEEITEKVTE